MTRRDFSCLAPLLGAMATASAEDPLLHARTYTFDKLPVHYSSGGAATRPVLRGTLPTGEAVELHETTLMPGQMPHPAHRHRHTEMMLVREGEIEFLLDSGPERVGPGGVAYAASGEKHGVRNPGTVPAKYFVIAIGTDPPL